jgi:glutaredoxin
MDRKASNLLVTALIVIIVGTIVFFAIRASIAGYVVKGTPVSAEAAQYIGNHSIVYVQAGCSHCKDQEDLFGDNWKYINTLDCVASKANIQICINNNITRTPTWVINGNQYIGVQSIQTLENLTGYIGQ